jgi:hypothetical protein
MQTNPVSCLDVPNIRADPFHLSGYLMPERNWQRPHAGAPGAIMRVRVTDPRGADAYKHILVACRGDGNSLQFQWLARLDHADGFHVVSPLMSHLPWRAVPGSPRLLT